MLEQLVLSGLSDAEWNELEACLLEDESSESVRRYIESIHLREELFLYAGEQVQGAADLTGQPSEPQAPQTERSDTSLADRATRVEGQRRQSWGGWFSLGFATLAAVLLVGFLLGRLGEAPRTERSAGGLLASTEQTPTWKAEPRGLEPPLFVNGPSSSQVSLCRITGLSPIASSEGLIRSLQVGEELRRGEVIQLRSGVLRAGFTSGSNVIIEGPADFCVVGERELFLRHGKIVASAEGSFVVQCPLARVESTGGNLSMVTSDDSATVFSRGGRVGLFANRGNRSSDSGKVLSKLVAGEGCTVSRVPRSPAAVVAAAEPEGMVHSWTQVEDALHPYEQLVLSDKPLAYWPLSGVRRNRRVLDLTQNGYDGQAIGNWPLDTGVAVDAGGRGAYFDGESYIEPDRKPGVDLTTGVTVESWVKVLGGPEYQSVFTSRWVHSSATPMQQCYGFTLYAGQGDTWEFWTGSGNYGEDWQTLVSQKRVERGEWTHVAATFTPEEISADQCVVGRVGLFVNGVEVAGATHKVSLVDFEWPARIGAAEFVPKALTSWLFQGELRDVALYDRAVPASRIKDHYEQGLPAG